MGDSSDSIPSDDSGIPDNSENLNPAPSGSNSVPVDELTDSSMFRTPQNCLQDIQLLLEGVDGIDPAAIEWILTHIMHWESLNDLSECKDLTAKQVKLLEAALTNAFKDLREKREVLLLKLVDCSLSREKLVASPLVKGFEMYDEELIEWCDTEEIKLYFSSVEIESIKRAVLNVKSLELYQSDKLTSLLMDMEAIMRDCNLGDGAIQEMLDRIQCAESLESGLQNCEELTIKQIKMLEQKLNEPFDTLQKLKKPEIRKAMPDFSSLSLANEALTWIQNWLECVDSLSSINLNDVEICEDLTKRQMTHVKDIVRDFYGIGQIVNEIAPEMNPRDRLLCDVEAILAGRDVQLDVAAQTWILENIIDMQSLDDLCECEDLTKKQISSLKLDLKAVFEDFWRTKADLTASPNEICEHNENKETQIENESSLDPTNLMQPPDITLEANGCIGESQFQLTQFIIVTTEMQDGFAVEKFSLSEDGVKYLCDLVPDQLVGEFPVFYNSCTHGMMIDFEVMNQLTIECVGLFGPLKGVIECLSKFSITTHLPALEKLLRSEKPGLYLLNFSRQKLNFILFNSENDSDFKFVRKDSRAVHFLRYMSQLCNNVVMCLDGNYEERLAVDENKTAVKTIRRSRYNLMKHETQQESIKLAKLGLIHDHVINDASLFSSMNGLFAINSQKTEEKVKKESEWKTGTVHDLKHMLETMHIKDLDSIGPSFKKEYLKICVPEEFRIVEEKILKKIEDLETESEEKTHELVVMSVALYFIKSEMFQLFKIVEAYLVDNTEATENIWNEKIDFDILSIDNVLSTTDSYHIRQAIRTKTEERQAIEKYLLWSALERSEKGLPEDIEQKGFDDTTWKELKHLAEKTFTTWIRSVIGMGLFSLSTVNDEKIKAINRIDFKNIDSRFRFCMQTFLNFVCQAIKPYNKMPQFIAYCQSQRSSNSLKLKQELLCCEVNVAFNKLMLRKPDDKYEITTQNELMGSIMLIRKIAKSPADEPRFTCQFEKTSKEAAKICVKFSQLTVTRNEHQRMQCGGQGLKVEEIDFLPVGEVNAGTIETVHAVYPVSISKILVIFNEQNKSRCEIYTLPKMSNPLKIPFGRQILDSSFDCKNRILALRMLEDLNWSIQLLKFDDDFKCRDNLKAVDLNKMFGVEKQFVFCLQPNSKFVWTYNEGRLWKIDYRARVLAMTVKISSKIVKLICTPDGGCLLSLTEDGSALPIMTDSGNVLDKIMNFGTESKLFFMCNQMLSVKKSGNALSVDQLTVTGSEHETKLTKTATWQSPEENKVTDEKLESHWINYIYWMFAKFPCNDNLSTNQQKSHFRFFSIKNNLKLRQQVQAEISSMQTKLHFTRKPLGCMEIHANVFVDKNLAGEFDVEALQLGDMLKKLITFIPIQIARCQSNTFCILDKGQPLLLDVVNDAFELTEKINLGFYESIFSSWYGDVKVISSMGKQSTGKSYTLNHLTGCSFNIAGTRCTDGCWMTVKQHDDCLYVILDFEGLGSIERTEQDDMLLSLFNSSISTITIFKTEKRIDREIDRMFGKINMGSDQLKGTEKVFKGKFMIVINDVAEQDVEDTPKEFEEKISTIVSKTENNFIKKLYNSDFEIVASPALESFEYYENIQNLLSIVTQEVKPLFKGGEFVNTLKLLMAKLAINDFSPLDRQQIDERVRILKSYLRNAIHFGQLSDDESKFKEYELKGLDNPCFKPLSEKNIDFAEIGVVKLKDLGIVFKEEQLGSILIKFLSIMTPTPENCLLWRTGLEKFVLECVNLRFERVQKWLEENLRKWKECDNAEYDDIICSVLENLANWKLKFIQTYKFCEETCNKCFLKCTQIVNHRGAHECSTSHYCTAKCAYCEPKEAEPCKMAFGHDGKHVCGEVNHVCGAPCRFTSLNGCSGECHNMTRHDGEHQCSERRHPCSQICSLEGCEGRCVIDCETEHTAHKCIKEQCISKCSIQTCTNKCSALDHFHGSIWSPTFRQEHAIIDELPFMLEDGARVYSAEHFCGKEHQCDYDCGHEGFCRVWTEKQLIEETFDGARDTFTYSLGFAEKGEKLKCRRKLEPFMRAHDGEHSCSTEVHICVVKCPTCENICDKPINHENEGDILHHARHGNMRKCFFIANEDDIQVGSHKYKVGEPAVAEMCHIFCNSLGRGHVHIIECDNWDPRQCAHSAEGDGRRHETTKYHPNPDIPKDEITHHAYWAWTGFRDPCQEVDLDEFQKCPALCSAADHDQEGTSMFCQMPLWHEPVQSIDEANLIDGYVTKDGHVFPCNHPVGVYHFVLCLDDSGSMRGYPWLDLVNAVRIFVGQRLRDTSPEKLSIVIYNSSPRIAAEYMPMDSFNESWLSYHSGGTKFNLALQMADDLIGRHLGQNTIPVLIFMSDGGSGSGEIEMRNMARKYHVAHGLQVYTLGFGNANFDKLRELARMGRGEFIDAVDGIELQTAFVEISAKHPPTIGVAL